MERVQLARCWVLHTRAYRDSSLLVDLLTAERGRLRGVARGARRLRRRTASAEPFAPLLVSWSGRGELLTLGALERTADAPPQLGGRCLLAALYFNELLYRLLPLGDPLPQLFADYGTALYALASTDSADRLASTLRRFELCLLRTLGYGIDFAFDAETEASVDAAGWYCFEPGVGFVSGTPGRDAFAGRALLSLAAGDFDAPELRRVAVSVTRRALAALLEAQPLVSRQCFAALPHALS